VEKKLTLFKLIPNIFTTVGMCSGLTGIRFAIDHEWKAAVICILFASFFDLIDGLTARAFRATSQFGAELDSLSDAISFGVTPSIILYIWLGTNFTESDNQYILGWYWIPFLVFSSCAVLRLARFNVSSLIENIADGKSGFFVGVPTPGGALLVLLPIMLQINADRFGYPLNASIYIIPVLCWTLIVSALMISSVPTYSFKSFSYRFSKNKATMILIASSLSVAIFIKESWVILALGTFVYFLSIPFSFHRSKQKPTD